jgi:hypothetical protein
MEPLNGQLALTHPLRELQKRADLVFFDGPLLSLFENKDGDPYFFIWADVDRDTNRWVVFRTASAGLSAFLNKNVTLRELVTHPSDGFLYVADLNAASDFGDVWIIPAAELPVAYLPASNSYYEFEPIAEQFDLQSLAERYRSPLLDLHLIKGKGVRFGTADVITLGSVLKSTGELAESVAIDLFGSRRGIQGLAREDARVYGQFEYITRKAASFSAILRPLATQVTLPDFADRTSEVIDVVLELISTSDNYEALKRVADKYQDSVLRHLEELVTDVQERDLALEVRWASPTQEEFKIARLDPVISGRILDNINRLEEDEAEGFWNQGAFLAVDIKLRTYRFLSQAGRESTGHFGVKLGYPLSHISFELEYRVFINRRFVKRTGQKRRRSLEVIGEVQPLEADGYSLDRVL